MATPFEVHGGSYQQRIPTDHAAEGTYGYELGHNQHLDVRLAVGDRHDLSQTFTISNQARFVKLRAYIAAPPILPVGGTWIFEALLNGVVHYSRRLAARTRVLDLSDIRLRLLGAPGSSIVTLRLRLA